MNVEVKPAKHSAPGQYLGFALQPVRAFYHLLSSPKGSKVSLELLDDVAIHYPDGGVCLEQTKSALKQNPISDWANDLWKTFDNWVTMLEADEIAREKTRFRLYVTPKRGGAFAAALAAASTQDEVGAILEVIRSKLAKKKEPPACIGFLQPLLDASIEDQTEIIVNFELESDDFDPLDTIRALLRPTVLETHIDLLVKSGIGQAKQAFDRLIQQGAKPIIDADIFRRDYGAFLRQNLLPGLLASLSETPDQHMVAGIMSTRPTFVRQLEFVEAPEDDRLRAVSDFLRTSFDKADWAERGLVFPNSLDEWDDGLLRKFSLVRGDVIDLHGDKAPEVQGRLTYRSCAQHQEPLEGRVVPGHFVHGSFNDLADRRRLGWHPDYEAFLDGDEG
ncbi:MAG: ABC-three component system protein [Sphingomonas sp.]